VGKVDYPAILEQAWQEHLAPREANAPTVISTFAGCGGSSLGYSMAGYRELLAVEWDDNAVATFKLNFPDVSVYHGDICKLSVEECLNLAKIESGQLDVLDGSPPCQGFSTAGKRVMTDARNSLFREFIRLLRGLRPKVFVMENVSGLIKGKMKLVFAEIMREMKASGYKVSCKLLNAMYFQVPQSRQRLIWIGVRNDLAIEPSHPKAESKPISAGQALVGVSDEGMPPPLSKRYISIVPKIRQGECADDIVSGAGFQSCVRISENKPSPTLPKMMTGSGYGSLLHPQENRALSIGECKRLGSFPDAFVFIGKYTFQGARIGNFQYHR